MARPKKEADKPEIDEPAFFIPEEPPKSERPTVAEGLKSDAPKAAFPQYRVLDDCKFVIGGGVYTLRKDQVISCMTHEILLVLPQIKTELL